MGEEQKVLKIWRSSVEHFVAKADCPNCPPGYPQPHTTGYTNCGGLLHAESPTGDDSLDLVIRCDKCGDLDILLSDVGKMFTAPDLVAKLVDHQPTTGELTSVAIHKNGDGSVSVTVDKLEQKHKVRTISFVLSATHAKGLGQALLRASRVM